MNDSIDVEELDSEQQQYGSNTGESQSRASMINSNNGVQNNFNSSSNQNLKFYAIEEETEDD